MTSKLKTDILETVSGSGTIALTNQLSGMTSASVPSGSVLQVVNFISTAKTSQTIVTSDTLVSDITKSITPLGDNSKFLVNIRWFGEVDTGWGIVFNIHMDGTRVNVNGQTNTWTGLAMPVTTYGLSSDNDSTPDTANFSTVVTTSAPAGTALVFKLMATGSASYVMWTNRCIGSAAADGYENSTSEIIITEIAG